MRASSYLPLPKELTAKKKKKKEACVNIQNNDEKCFLWSIRELIRIGFQNIKNMNVS